MKAVIMAGGKGTRLRPLTCARPKPMVPVLNRPCMEHIINLLRAYQITEIGVTLQYLPDAIRDYFGTGSRFGVKLHYFVEETPLGTAGSVKNAASLLDETFLVISGDALTNCNLQEAWDFHKARGALATLVLTPVSCPLEYGVVITGADGRISRFLEKPGWGEVFSDTVNTGIYILEPEVLDYITPGKMTDFSKDLYPGLLADGRPLYAFVTKGYWCDIGSVSAYLQAHYDLLDRRSHLPLEGREVKPGIWLEGQVKLDATARLHPPVWLGAGCVIGRGATVGPYTVLGREVRLEDNASVKRSVVWDHARIGRGAELRGAVVGTGASIKAAASLYEEAVVGDRSTIGEKSLVKSGVKVWPEKWVEQGTRLTSSLVWGSCTRPHFFGASGITGDPVTELCPDFVSRLGTAVGSVAELPARFSLSTDGYTCSQLVKHALFAGLMATGVQVLDFGSIILPVHRYGVRALRLKGGIHISHRGKGKVNLRFFNGQGIEYSRSEQRKVEGMLSREEYRLVGVEEMAPPEYIPELNPAYLHFLLEFLDKEVTRRARPRVVVDYNPERLGSLLPPLFEELGCQMITFATPRKGSQTFGEMLKIAGHFGEVVREEGAQLGAVLDAGGEDLVLVDEKGEMVQRDAFISLLSLITLKANRRPTLVLPVTAPQALEDMVTSRGGRVRRTKTAPWSLMQTCLEEEVLRSQEHYPQFLIYGDALATLAVVTEFLAREGRLLSQVIQELPTFATAKREVEVTWDDKGKVLRSLAEEAGEGSVEMLEGIKLHHPEGWALVLPDADEPLCRVYSEGFNQETAESLTEMYVDKIREICAGRSEEQPSV